ncbi:MAG TPA: hypothetical protein DDY20_09185 [Desulfobulbaceae bacterium]|nr:hypothetical protein [Desulfobulbaceae bacterium]
MNILKNWKFPLFVSILLSFLYVHYFGSRAFVELDIQVEKTTWFKIYWAKPGKLFSEKNMARIRVRPEQEHYRFFLTNLRSVEQLRIDPHQYEGEAVVKKLEISQSGMQTIRFAGADDFAGLEPIFQVAQSSFREEGFAVISSGGDPQFLYIVTSPGTLPWLQEMLRIAAIFGAVFLFFALSEPLRDDQRFIPLFFAAALLLVLVMASISAPEVHPDEYVHFDAAAYYMEHWLPPVVDDPSIRQTYSVYGVSRLNNREICYLLTGKLAQLLVPFKLPAYLGLRLFNVLLFTLIVLTVLRYREARMLAVPFLLSPQLWYQFSYCNSDAFALFLTFVLAFQVVVPDSLLNTYLAQGKGKALLGRAIGFGLLCSMLLLLKKNYYLFLFFLLGYFLWKHFLAGVLVDKKLFLQRLALIIIIALGFVALRVGVDYWVNGPEREEKISRLRAEMADPLFNPNTPLEQRHAHLYRKARGDSLKQLVIDEKWFGKTFRSTFGMYGYFTISATDAYYDFVRLVGVCFLLFYLGAVLLKAPGPEKLLFLFFLGCVLGLIGISLWHSWTADFQTQGRYLFPLIPMLGVVVYHTRRFVPDAGFRLFLVAMFALSLYSYIYIALMFIPKAVLDSALWLPQT